MTFLAVLLAFILGVICSPLIIFLRARRDDAWDDSNMTNIFRLVAHIATHPSDFGKMYYEDGTKPFWYINKDELSDVVNTRPSENKIK
jgi:hypothetical protein